MPNLVTLCTGNAARSVMAGAILAEHVPARARCQINQFAQQTFHVERVSKKAPVLRGAKSVFPAEIISPIGRHGTG